MLAVEGLIAARALLQLASDANCWAWPWEVCPTWRDLRWGQRGGHANVDILDD